MIHWLVIVNWFLGAPQGRRLKIPLCRQRNELCFAADSSPKPRQQQALPQQFLLQLASLPGKKIRLVA
jgi:hypothetical protein